MKYKIAQQEARDVEAMLADSTLDKEMRDMLEEEKFTLSKKVPELEHQIKDLNKAVDEKWFSTEMLNRELFYLG